MKISLISTIFNEEKTIKIFLDSIFLQSKNPDEIILVDGGSTDKTREHIKQYVHQEKSKKTTVRVFEKKGNRSVGRNEAIKHAKGKIIVCTDAGNILHKDWVKNIVRPFQDPKTDVVAGYYKGLGKTVFQKCVIPYALVMEDKINPQIFLPATRSIAFRKSIWKKVAGFPEQYSHNEDYVFAKRLENIHANIVFAKDAIVYWMPRKTFKEAFVMFFRFALGDGESGLFRPKVALLFLRYVLVCSLIVITLRYQSLPDLLFLIFLFLLYIIWAVFKNYRYVQAREAIMLLPLLQFTADAAVISGTITGLVGLHNLKFWKREDKVSA